MIDEDFFVNKVDKNTAFFSVYYMGSWLSGGSFTFENCQKTVELAVEFVKNKQGIKTFNDKQINWNYSNLYVMGYSFSGNPVVSTKITKNDVKNVILFAPLLFLHKKEVLESMKDKEAIDNFYGFNSFYLEFLRRGYKFAFRGIKKKGWNKYFSGKESKSFIKIDKNYPNVIIFHGKSDEKINYTSSLFFQKEKDNKAKVILVDNVGHSLEKLFDMNQINKLI
ncbi:MAG: hypothetical protein WC158_01580 [Candidatus Paceibacterota bacterium]|nr:hypothetical protein [Candidatus Paceibacterota bacterium]MDD4467035.1 hypothetical protein [Candidatus Paceibacterota bacterium]MDD4897262.1 hypothetical protein [Candidatus Paceibacterota bacterium]